MTTKGRPLARPAPAGAATWADRCPVGCGGRGALVDCADRRPRAARSARAWRLPTPRKWLWLQDYLPSVPPSSRSSEDGRQVGAVLRSRPNWRTILDLPHWGQRWLRGSTAAEERGEGDVLRHVVGEPAHPGPAWRRGRAICAWALLPLAVRNSPAVPAGWLIDFKGADRDLVAGHAGIHVGLQLGGALDLPHCQPAAAAPDRLKVV